MNVCAHHWHADERGWVCCHCPDRVSKRQVRPEPARDDCARAGDGGLSWLDGLLPELA